MFALGGTLSAMPANRMMSEAGTSCWFQQRLKNPAGCRASDSFQLRTKQLTNALLDSLTASISSHFGCALWFRSRSWVLWVQHLRGQSLCKGPQLTAE